MKLMDDHKAKTDCVRHERLFLEEMGDLNQEEAAFLATHQAACPDCATERRVLDLLADDGSGDPAEPLDELNRRRLINSVLADTGRRAQEQPQRVSQSVRGRVLLGAVAAGILLVGAGVALLSGPSSAPSQTPATLAPTLSPRTPSQTRVEFPGVPRIWISAARILLRSGTAVIDGEATEVGGSLQPGQMLQVAGASKVAFQLPMGSRVLAGSQCEVKLEQLSSHKIQLNLRRGELVAAVTRRKAHQAFVVRTARGKVTVKGTLFSLRADSAGVQLGVLEGRVLVEDKDQQARVLLKGQSIRLQGPGDRVQPLSSRERKRITRRGRLLALLYDGERGATAQFKSRPTGAGVLVNGTRMGRTPMLAVLRTGQHRLKVTRDGFRPATERLLLQANDVVLRDFQLAPLVASAQGAGSPPQQDEASVPEDKQKARQQLQALKQDVSQLRSKVIHSKLTLNRIKQALSASDGSCARAVIKHRDEMGRSFKMIRLSYALDGEPLRFKYESAESPDPELVVQDRCVKPGSHLLSVHMVFRGRGFGVFPYLEGYKLDVRSSHSFVVPQGKRTTVKVRVFENKGITTRWEELPAVQYLME